MKTRVLAVDPGEKRLGLAISDPTCMIANPLSVFEHISREKNARKIISIAEDNEVALIIIGISLTETGEVSFRGRKSERLASEIQNLSDFPVKLWDEYGSTQMAKESRLKIGIKKTKRKGHHDEIAATVILQSYLDANFKTPIL